jgi:hypothetical protein
MKHAIHTQGVRKMEREIKYDRVTKDFAAYLDGRLIGYFSSYHAAEVALDELVYDELAAAGAFVLARFA